MGKNKKNRKTREARKVHMRLLRAFFVAFGAVVLMTLIHHETIKLMADGAIAAAFDLALTAE